MKLSEIARNGQSGIPLFIAQILLLSYSSLKNICRIFVLSIPAKSESVGIFEISLSVFRLCPKKLFLFFEKKFLNLSLNKYLGFLRLQIL